MSTILPLEVVFGQSTFSLDSDFGKTGLFPSFLFVEPLDLIVTEIQTSQINVYTDADYAIKHNTRSFAIPVQYVGLKDGLGSFYPDWNEAIKALYDYNVSFAPYGLNAYQQIPSGSVVKNIYDFGAGGKIPEEVWRNSVMPDYTWISPIHGPDGDVSYPMEDGAIGVPPWLNELFTGECGSGGGSERPESGLLYPRKV